MKWSIKLGRYGGIDVYLHVTFLLLLGWVLLSHWIVSRDLGVALVGLGFIVAIFGSVLLHEFGHALMARRYGIPTRDITLLPIGGVARLERMPDDPRQELRVALAGPAVNVVIAGVLFVILHVGQGIQPLSDVSVVGGSLIERLMLVNLFLVGFNMIPAFPMDGGRVLRSLLAMRMDYARATSIAATIGQFAALLFGFIGLFSNPLLIFIALFVWIGAAQEASMAQMKSALGGIPVSRAMLTDFRTLEPGDPLGRAVELILAGSQHEFPIVEGDTLRGILTRTDLFSALNNGGQNEPVERFMKTDFQTAEDGEMLEWAFGRLEAHNCDAIPVLRRGALVGLLTKDNVGEFLMIQSAMGTHPGTLRRAGT